MATMEFLLAESGIRQLYGCYADAVWRQDSASFGQCFTEDAVWKIAGRRAVGRAEIVALFEASLAASERVMFWSAIQGIELCAGGATGRAQVTELIKRKDGQGLRTLGMYYERFAVEDGAWRIAWHHFDLLYLGTPDLSDAIYDAPDYGPAPAMPGSGDPTTVPR